MNTKKDIASAIALVICTILIGIMIAISALGI